MSSRRAVIEGVGGPDTLRIDVRARPEPGVGEVRVRVLAAGIAASDRNVDAIGAAADGDQEWITSFGARFLDRADTLPRVAAVFDPLGGASLARSFAALHPGGRLVSYGFLDAVRRPSVLLSLLRVRWWSLLPTGRGTAFYRLSAADPRRLHQVLGTLVDALAAGRLRPGSARGSRCATRPRHIG